MREKLSACVLDAADNLDKGLLKETLGNMNEKMNALYVFYCSEVGTAKHKAQLSD